MAGPPFYDGTRAANSGHFVVNGTVVLAETVYTITAAQLAQTIFVAGAGTSDDLYAMATDRQLNSNNNVFGPFHVNHTLRIDLSADHFDQIFGAGVLAPIDAKSAFGIHTEATIDPLALFGMHAADHAHFTF
jgi:hypothetical protein